MNMQPDNDEPTSNDTSELCTDIDRLCERAARAGREYEIAFHGCGQCTVAAIQDALDLRNGDVFLSASAFGAGVSKFGDGNCGAYLGACLIISHLYGRSREGFSGEREQLSRVYRLVSAVRARFVDTYGSTLCSGVQDRIFGRHFNIWDEADKTKFEESGAHSDKCPEVVANGANWTVRLIAEEQQRLGNPLPCSNHRETSNCGSLLRTASPLTSPRGERRKSHDENDRHI